MSRPVSVIAVILAASVSLPAAAGCGHNHKAYPEGGITCTGHRQLQCGAMGVWHPLPGHCDADPPQPTKPAPEQPPANAGKETGGKAGPAGG
jgi:hypothetical protein